MMRMNPLAYSVALLLSSTLNAAETPLYQQVPENTLQALSPKPLTLSNELMQKEGYLHWAERTTAGNRLIATANHYGFSLIRFQDNKFTTLKDYSFEELDAQNGVNIQIAADDSMLFIKNYNSTTAFSVATDGTLSKVTSSTTNASIQHHSFGSEGNSYISTESNYPNFRVSVHQLDPQSKQFVRKTLLTLDQQPQYVIYDDSKKLVITASYSYTGSGYPLRTYKADESGNYNLVTEISLPQIPSESNVAYSASSGNLFLASHSSYFKHLHVDVDGVVQDLTDLNDIELPNYSHSAALSAKGLYLYSGSSVQLLTLDGTRITGSQSIELNEALAVSPLADSLAVLQNNSLSYLAADLDPAKTVELKRGEQSLSWTQLNTTAGDSIDFGNGYFFRQGQSNSELHKVDSTGKIISVRYFTPDDLMPGNSSWNTGIVTQTADNKLLAIRGSQVRIYSFDKTTESLIQQAELDLNDLLQQVNQFHGSSSAKVFGPYLLVNTDYKLHLFKFSGNSLSYMDTASAGVNGFEQIPALNIAAESNGKLFVYNGPNTTLYEMAVVNNRLTQKKLQRTTYGGWGAPQIKAVGDQIHLKSDLNLYVFKEIDNKFTLLSMTYMGNNPVFYIDNRFVVSQNDLSFADIYQLDKTSGIPAKVDSIELGQSQQLTDVFTAWNKLYFASIGSNLTQFRQYDLNRAPDMLQQPAPLQLNEGVSSEFAVNAYLGDPDQNDSISFSLAEAVPGMALTSAGALSYNGNLISSNAISIKATDSQGLYTELQLPLQGNKAPVVSQAWGAPVVNQNQSFTFDLNEFFADPEGSVLTYSITGATGLTASSKGVISGKLSATQALELNAVIKDAQGATSSHVLALKVNAAPVLSGSANLTMTTEEAVSVNLTSLFSDAEGQTISFTATGLPAGLTLSGSTIAGTVTNAGSFSSLITATDSAGAVSQATLNFAATKPKSSGGSSGFYMLFAVAGLLFSRRFK